MKTIIIDGKETLRDRMLLAWNIVNDLVEVKKLVIEIKEFSKSRDQEKKYHAMIEDIAKAGLVDECYNITIWKVLLKDQFGEEKKLQGDPLRYPSRVVKSLDGQRLIYTTPFSRDFSAKEASEFIEYLYCYGSENQVPWSEDSLKAYQEYGVRL